MTNINENREAEFMQLSLRLLNTEMALEKAQIAIALVYDKAADALDAELIKAGLVPAKENPIRSLTPDDAQAALSSYVTKTMISYSRAIQQP